MKICYCEDEAAQAEILKEKASAWSEAGGIQLQTDLFESAEEFLFKAEGDTYDLVFLDISMKKMNGMELAKQIRAKDKNVIIVFVTSDPSFVFEGYEVGAYRYLMKPFTDEKLYEILDYSAARRSGSDNFIVVKTTTENRRIDLEELLYIEVQGHYVDLHLADNDILSFKSSFSEILEQANAKKELFQLTHRSYAVNLSKITRIGRTECILEGGQSLPVSRSAYKPLNDSFIKYNLER